MKFVHNWKKKHLESWIKLVTLIDDLETLMIVEL